jgi:lysine 2,3-aminomutase
MYHMGNEAAQLRSEKSNNNGKENGKGFGKTTQDNVKTSKNDLSSGRNLLLEDKMTAPTASTAVTKSIEESPSGCQKEEWEILLQEGATTAEDLAKYFPLTQQEIETINKVRSVYPMMLNKHAIELIRVKGDPVWDQFVPNEKELHYSDIVKDDPQNEEGDQPVPGVPLTHRYPDRVLFLVSNKCAAYCRHCTRKRRVGKKDRNVTENQIVKGVEYIQRHKEVRDVLLSGGDPLMLKDDDLEFILQMLKPIKHVEMIRIGTRVPCVLPQRITPELVAMLKKYHPLYMNIQFNHPWELSKEARQACNMLADAGIPLGNQSVLLKGINDNPELYKSLCHELLKVRVKPYYLYQCDLVKGTEHFRVKTLKGIEIMDNMKWHTTGFAIPKFVIDTPGGSGKIEVYNKDTIMAMNDSATMLKNHNGEIIRYPEPREDIEFKSEITDELKESREQPPPPVTGAEKRSNPEDKK